MKQTVTKFKWIWAWNDEQEEQWLEEMSAAGLHLEAVPFAAIYRFRSGAPKASIYRLDYKEHNRDLQEYLQLFRDAGWEHVGAMGGWQYFRRDKRPGDNTEIFTDAASKIAKYQRVRNLLLGILPLLLLVFVNGGMNRMGAAVDVLAVFFAAVVIFYIFGIVNLERRIRALQKKL